MKLHLGCGQKYFEGYVNIDYPPSEHTVMEETVADEFHNLFELSYPAKTVAEVRLHHVFEHFSRSHACALLAGWNSWLKDGGILHIEVPDFYNTAKVILNPLSSDKKKSVAMRHIFGSQEAHWAIHFDGYSRSSLKILLELFGFEPIEFKTNSWRGTHNIEVIGKKIRNLNLIDARDAASKYLSRFMVDESPSEQEQLNTWLRNYNDQVIKSFADQVQ